MKTLMIILIALTLAGCGTTYQYPTTGNAGIDMALANPALSHQTKMNLIRRHRGEEPVFAEVKRATMNPVAASYRPVIDQSVCRDCNYENDLAQCQQIASDNTNVTGSAATNAALGAGSSAIIGALLDVDVRHMAAMGASVGGLQGVGQELNTIRGVIARCMQGRGYSVLR